MRTHVTFIHVCHTDQGLAEPLFFLDLENIICGQTMDYKTAGKILAYLDKCYGNTDQDLVEWAVEYQLWARMLLNGDSIAINPAKLEIDSEMEREICNLLCGLRADRSSVAIMKYRAIRKVPVEALRAAWEAYSSALGETAHSFPFELTKL